MGWFLILFFAMLFYSQLNVFIHNRIYVLIYSVRQHQVCASSGIVGFVTWFGGDIWVIHQLFKQADMDYLPPTRDTRHRNIPNATNKSEP